MAGLHEFRIRAIAALTLTSRTKGFRLNPLTVTSSQYDKPSKFWERCIDLKKPTVPALAISTGILSEIVGSGVFIASGVLEMTNKRDESVALPVLAVPHVFTRGSEMTPGDPNVLRGVAAAAMVFNNFAAAVVPTFELPSFD